MKTLHVIRLWAAWSLAIGVWVVNPFLSMRYYELTQRLGFYPTNADSIGIPILGTFFIAIIGLPVWFIFCRFAFRQLSGPFKLFNREPTQTWKAIGITLAFGFCIYLNIQSARHYHDLFYVIQKSHFSHLSELASYLMVSSFGWAILWVILGACFIAGTKTGKEDAAHTGPGISLLLILGWLAAFIVAFRAGSDLWDKTIVRSKDELQAISKEMEMVGIWKPDLTEFSSKDQRVESFRKFKITLYPDRSFTADAVPNGIFFNNTVNTVDLKGAWKIRCFDNCYSIDLSVQNIDGTGGSFGSPLMLENGHYVFMIDGSINVVRTSSATDG